MYPAGAGVVLAVQILLASAGSVHAQDRWGLVRISRGRESLADCIGRQGFFNATADRGGGRPHATELELLVRVATENFHSKTSTSQEFADFLSKFWLNWPALDSASRQNLDERVVEALIRCSDRDDHGGAAAGTDASSPRQALPVFLDASPRNRVNLLLDYLLVGWSDQDVFGAAGSRAAVRQYAEDVFDVFAGFEPSAARELDFDLRFRWERRARLFYDDRSPEHPYVGHVYSLDSPTPYTLDDPSWFVGRRREAYRTRNQPASPSKLRRLESIYREDPDNVDGDPKRDFVRAYESRGMTRADDYFQRLRIQNCRVLLVLLDLALAGALGEGEGDYEVPPHSRALLRDDDAYRDYLAKQRRRVLDATAGDEDRDVARYRGFLEEASRVREECLIALLVRKLSTDDLKTTESRTDLDGAGAVDTSILSTTPKSPDDAAQRDSTTLFRKRLQKCTRRSLGFDCRRRNCGGKPNTSQQQQQQQQCATATSSLRRNSSKTRSHQDPDETVRSMKILASSLRIGFARSFPRE